MTTALLMSLVACSTQDAAEPEPTPEADAESTPTGVTSSPTTTALPGMDVDAPELSYRLPGRGWRVSRAGYSAYKDFPTVAWSLGIGVHQSFAGDSTDAHAKLALASAPVMDPPVERRDDRTVGGVEGFVLEGSGPDGLFYEFGVVTGGRRIYLDFEATEDTPAAREWIAHVLGSVRWS